MPTVLPIVLDALPLIIVATLGMVATVVAAAIAARSARSARRSNRVDEVELLLDGYRKDTQRLYLYNRQLVDHIYRDLGPPPPPPPAGLFA